MSKEKEKRNYKSIPDDEKDVMGRKRASGMSLKQISKEHHIDYGVVRNLASKHNWEVDNSTIITDRMHEDKANAKKRNTAKNKYKAITGKLRNKISSAIQKEEYEKADGLAKFAQAVNITFAVDKDIHNILTSKEEQDLINKELKNQELINELEGEDENNHIE